MLHPSSPKHNDKSDTEQWIDNFRKLFQLLDLIFVFLLQSFIFVKFLKCLFLFLLIDIDKLIPPELQFYVLADHVLRRRKKSVTSPSQEYKSIGIGKFDLEKNLDHCDKYSFSKHNSRIGLNSLFSSQNYFDAIKLTF